MYCSSPEAVPSEFICCVVTSVSVSLVFFPYEIEHALPPPRLLGGFLGTFRTGCTASSEDELCFDAALDE